MVEWQDIEGQFIGAQIFRADWDSNALDQKAHIQFIEIH